MGAWNVAEKQRPKMGEKGYLQADAAKDVEALERAVMNGPDAVEKFYAKRGGAPYTAKALGIACRYVGPETVRKLLEHGASFRAAVKPARGMDPHRPFELMILPGAPAMVQRKRKVQITPEERLEMVRMLIANGAGDFSELLYQAILLREFPIARELLDAGTKLPKHRLKLIDGSVGFKDPSQGVSEEDRMAFRKAMRNATDSQLKEMITLLHQCEGVDQVAVYDLDICDIVRYVPGSKTILDRFRKPDMLTFMLEHTTMRKVVTRRMLVEVVAENNDVESLRWMLDNGFLNRRTEIQMLFDVLEGTGNAEMQAMAVAHDAAHRPKKDDALSIPTDPFAASLLRKIWQYETAGDGKSVRILRYKGDGDTVVVPPRIGRRPVTEIADTALSPPRPKTPSRKRGYGGWRTFFRNRANNTPPSVQRVCYKSVSFPGSIRVIPQCLGEHNACANTQEVILLEGVEATEPYAFSRTDIRSLVLPESLQRPGVSAFAECRQLIEVKLPDSLAHIPDGMFCKCSQLRQVRFGAGLESIGKDAFRKTRLEIVDFRSVRKIGQGALAECTELREVTLPPELQEIPDELFSGCSRLRQLPVCAGVTRIGAGAFEKTGLTQVEIGGKTQSIGAGAFQECVTLQFADLGAAELTSLPDQIFRRCSALSSVTLPAGLKAIGERAFQYCNALAGIALPSGLETIRDEAFRGCGTLAELTLPDGLEDIGAGAFQQCEALTDIRVPDSVTRVGKKAFCETGLTSVEVCAGLSYGQEVFSKCRRLTRATVQDGVCSIPARMFSKCTALRELDIPGTICRIGISAFHGSGLESVQIPGSVETIEAHAFASTQLARVEIPETVHAVGNGAFRSCENLREVVLPGDGEHRCAADPEIQTTVGKEAFAGTGLRTVRIPPGIIAETRVFAECPDLKEAYVAGGAVLLEATFCQCRSLEKITLGQGAEEVPPSLGMECGALREVRLADTVKKIGDKAFFATGLTEFEIPETVVSIGTQAFASSKLRRIVIPPTVTTIGQGAFQNCPDLEEVVLPDGLRKIPPLMFSGCRSLKEIRIPGSVISIGKGAFAETALEQAQIPKGVQTVAPALFQKCVRLREVVLPPVQIIGSDAFASCGSLRHIALPEGVREIQPRAFENSGLESICVPASVTRIGNAAFRGCGSLQDVDILGEEVRIVGAAFKKTPVQKLHKVPGAGTYRRIHVNGKN